MRKNGKRTVPLDIFPYHARSGVRVRVGRVSSNALTVGAKQRQRQEAGTDKSAETHAPGKTQRQADAGKTQRSLRTQQRRQYYVRVRVRVMVSRVSIRARVRVRFMIWWFGWEMSVRGNIQGECRTLGKTDRQTRVKTLRRRG